MRLDDKEVKKFQIDRGLSSDDIAKALGITRQAFNSWLRHNSDPTMDNLGRLIEVLGCTPNDILIWNGKSENPTGR